ncbi:hypothetical protein PILCRDRAFT_13847 [Piloderma croceum F 1598]|uniref:Uncharacterized protein n=1 Tax=Piloderma croceum (strain F 1598) TaxID=765440 RepID=A0A0C3AMQ9_PILCF|nr:hypothetical protein PILCRDRAFT_13847 [Piloderma croceum F 1598]
MLHTFAASPNPYRNKKARREAKEQSTQPTAVQQDQLLSTDEMDDKDIADGEYHIGTNSEWKKEYLGFSQNPLEIVPCISMLAFVWLNCATNVLTLVLGLLKFFFKISGTGVCVINMLSNVGTDFTPLTTTQYPFSLRLITHKDIVDAVKVMMQEDRPLPLEKMDTAIWDL